MLFDPTLPRISGYATHGSRSFEYLERSDRPEIVSIRTLLESWFSHYPEQEKTKLKSSLQSDIHPAFFELYLHELLIKLDYKVKVHPEIQGKLNHPDFLAEKSEERLYIEARHIGLKSEDEKARQRLIGTLYDALNKVDATNFVLRIKELTLLSKVQPKGKLIRNWIHAKIENESADKHEQRIQDEGYASIEDIMYQDADVKLVFNLLPKPIDKRIKQSSAIAVYPGEIKWGYDEDSIKRALKVKAADHTELGTAYIIALNKPAINLDHREIDIALFGSNGFDSEPPGDDSDLGFFGVKRKPLHTRVSGVYFSNVNYSNVSIAEHLYFPHPMAKFPVSFPVTKTPKAILMLE